MPIYEYACAACDHHFEEWQKMSDPPVRTCPKCKKKKVERLISQTAFQLKGGGWYADLYSSSKPGAGKESGDKEKPAGKDSASAAAPAASEGKSAGKSDKSETKTKTKSESTKAPTAKKAEPRAA